MCAAIALGLAAGCVFDPVSLAGKECPCTDGWTCNPATNLCERGMRSDGGGADGPSGADSGHEDASEPDGGMPFDAGPAGNDAGPNDSGVEPMDAGPVDGGAIDGGPADGGPIDGGPVDSGPIDSGPIDAGPRDCRTVPGVIYCTSFEDPTLPDYDATVERTGTVATSSAQVHTGALALRAQITATDGRATLRNYGFASIASGEIWTRVWVYVPAGTSLHNLVFLALGEGVPPYGTYSTALHDMGVTTLWLDSTMSSFASGSGAVPVGRWVCMESRVVVSNTAGSGEIYVDGTRVGSQSGIDTSMATPYANFSVGINWVSASQAPATIYLDDLAIGTMRQPCSP